MSATVGRAERARVQREERRAQILTSALSVFAERGYHQTSVTHLVEAAGVARGTFYQYFDSKQQIFLDLLDALEGAFRGSVRGMDPAEGFTSMPEQVTHSITTILDAVASQRAIATILFREAVGLGSEVDERVAHFEAIFHAYLMDALNNGVARGWLRPHDTEVVATCIYGSIRQIIHRYVVQQGATFDRDHVAREVVTLHLRGLTAP